MLDALDVGRVNVACRALGILDRFLAWRGRARRPRRRRRRRRAVDERLHRGAAHDQLADPQHAAGDELARLRRDAPQTQIGEGANDALLMALARPLLR